MVRSPRAHLGETTGPRAVLGSQRIRLGRQRGIYLHAPLHSWPLRAEDGSRSGSWAAPGAVVAPPRCARSARSEIADEGFFLEAVDPLLFQPAPFFEQ